LYFSANNDVAEIVVPVLVAVLSGVGVYRLEVAFDVSGGDRVNRGIHQANTQLATGKAAAEVYAAACKAQGPGASLDQGELPVWALPGVGLVFDGDEE
jgi:hypothetical protein